LIADAIADMLSTRAKSGPYSLMAPMLSSATIASIESKARASPSCPLAPSGEGIALEHVC